MPSSLPFVRFCRISSVLGRCATVALLVTLGTLLSAAETAISLGEDVMPGRTVAADQTGLWASGTSVQVHVAVSDDAGAATTDTVTIRSGSPGLPEDSWGPAVTGAAGTTIAYPVDAVTAAHTEVYVSVVDAGGNRMTSRFTVVR